MVMKKIFNIPAAKSMLIGIICFSSCETVYDGTYDRYNPTPITLENVNLNYEPVSSYPIPDVMIDSKAPTYDAEGPVDFGIDTVVAVNDTKFQIGKFKINRSSGMVSYDNKGGTIEPGVYLVDISILNTTGYAVVDSAYKLTILSVPIDVAADPVSADVEYLYSGVVSTLSYVPVDVSEEELGKVTFEIDPEVKGFSIDKTDIVKNTDATPGEHKLTILVTTDLGETELKNLVTVTVGEKPELKYYQQNGTDSLGKITLSPWASYTTAPPVLTGMTADGWKVILPDDAPGALADAVSVDASGSVMVEGGHGIPDGDYLIGVKAGYGEEWVTFKDLFTLSVVTDWGEMVIANEDLDDTKGIVTYVKADGTDRKFNFNINTAGYPAAKLFFKTAETIDSWMILKLSMPADYDGNDFKVVFDEELNKGVANYTEFTRTVEFSHDQASWSVSMANDDDAWPRDTPGTYTIRSSPVVLDAAQPEFYFKWHYVNLSVSENGTFYINNIKFKYSKYFEPVEE